MPSNYGNRRDTSHNDTLPKNDVPKIEVSKIVSNGFDLDTLKQAEEFGKYVKEKNLNTSQLRKIFSNIKIIEAKGLDKMEAELLMLKPLTSYAATRNSNTKNTGLLDFKKKIIDPGIDEVLKEKDENKKKDKFKHFVDLVVAVLSYHKEAGGK